MEKFKIQSNAHTVVKYKLKTNYHKQYSVTDVSVYYCVRTIPILSQTVYTKAMQ